MKAKDLLLITAVCLLAGVSAEGRDRSHRRRRSITPVFSRVKLVHLDPVLAGLSGPTVCDDVTGRVTLTDGRSTVVICPGMGTAMVNGETVHTGHFVTADDTRILVPENFMLVVKRMFTGARRLRKVVIDPGHGGKDPGAIGRDGLREKDVNLSIALRLARLLREREIAVVLTRESDVFVPLDKRVKMSNGESPDLFISIHTNSSKFKAARGVETFFIRETTDDLARARAAGRMGGTVEGVDLKQGDAYLGVALRHTLLDVSRSRSLKIGTKIQKSLHKGLLTQDRGVKGAGFRVLKGALCPALLVEVGFISNPPTEKKLKNPRYLDRIAKAISAGM